MNLITKEITQSKEYKDLLEAIIKIKNKNISYEELEKIIIDFGTHITKDYIRRSGLVNHEMFDNISFEIANLTDEVGGLYNVNKQKITINSKVIQELFEGNLKGLAIIFHELNHMKVKADLINDVYNISQYRILKEILVRNATIDEFEYAKKSRSFVNYYYSNYESYSEEIYVEMLALLELTMVIDDLGFSLPDNFIKYITKELKSLQNEWSNLDRDFTYVSNNNNYNMNLFEAFDEYFNMNKQWLKECPLLQIEYYLDENGNIKKRSIEELIELMNKEIYEPKRLFINDLIENRTSSLKEKEDRYLIEENEISNSNKRF